MAAFLPPNIVINILAELDVKALTRFKCVSKAWFHLISSPCFHDLHCSRSQHKLCILSRSNIDFHNQFGLAYQLSSFNIDDSRPDLRSKFIAKVDGPIRHILPSCRGLFCFATEARIYVYNPATHRLVPLPPIDNETIMCGFGFAYFSSSKCYCVVRLLYRKSTRKIECSVLKLRGGSKVSELAWRVTDKVCPYFVDEFGLPACVQGTIYWKISQRQRHNNNNIDDDILCFNIEENEFGVIKNPTDLRLTAYNWTQLVELDGVLCMVLFCPNTVAIWLLRDRQWHRGVVIDSTGIDRRLVGQINCIKDGEIVFVSVYCNNLLFYNTKTRRFKLMQIPVVVHDLGIYWESLFPLGDYH